MLLRRVVAALMLLPTWACTTLQPVVAPDQFIRQEQPLRIYVLKADSSLQVIDRPGVTDGHITGLFAGTLVPTEVALPDVLEVRARRAAPGRTVLLAGGAAVALAGLVFAVASATSTSTPPVFYCEPQCTGYPR